MRNAAGKQVLTTTRKFERLALELEEMAANGGSRWEFSIKFSQFADAEDRYHGAVAIKPYSDLAFAAFEAFWARPENNDVT